MMNKTLDDYLALPYTIEVIPDDGAWFAQIKELPGCMTEVDAWDDILPAIEDAKRLWLELDQPQGGVDLFGKPTALRFYRAKSVGA